MVWLSDGGGVKFGRNGVVFSEGAVKSAGGGEGSSCGLRIRMQPEVANLDDSGTLLVFYTAEDPTKFRLMQYRDELLIRRDYRDERKRLKTLELELEHVFQRDEPVTFTITAGPGGAVAYRNGLRVGAAAGMGLSCGDFSGQLVLGDSPVSTNSWQGKIMEVEVYRGELTEHEIAQRDGIVNGMPGGRSNGDEGRDGRMVRRYTFSEGTGRLAHNSVTGGPNLYIPEAFQIIHKPMLMMPWQEDRDKLSAWDVGVNIAGFVPFGLALVAFLMRGGPENGGADPRRKRAMILTVLAGFAISVTIEVLQAFIPSRDSGVLDIFTNTLGTYLGVLLFGWGPVQEYGRKLGVLEAREKL